MACVLEHFLPAGPPINLKKLHLCAMLAPLSHTQAKAHDQLFTGLLELAECDLEVVWVEVEQILQLKVDSEIWSYQ